MELSVVLSYISSSFSLIISGTIILLNDHEPVLASDLVRDIGYITSFCCFTLLGFTFLRRLKKFPAFKPVGLAYLGTLTCEMGGIVGIQQKRNASFADLSAVRLVESCRVIGTVCIIIAGSYLEEMRGFQLFAKWIFAFGVVADSVGIVCFLFYPELYLTESVILLSASFASTLAAYSMYKLS